MKTRSIRREKAAAPLVRLLLNEYNAIKPDNAAAKMTGIRYGWYWNIRN